MWILLNAATGRLSREVRFSWATLDAARLYGRDRMHQFDLRVENRETGERWERVAGGWREAPIAPPPLSTGTPPAVEPAPAPRSWWQDRD